jgi:hypothetical protein
MISRGQMYRQMYNIGGEGIMSLDAGAPSIKYTGDIKPQMTSAPDPMADLQDQFFNMKQQGLIPEDMTFEAFKELMREQAAYGGRMHYGLGSLVKKAVKGVTGAVKDVVKSDIGKAALLYAGTAGLGSLGAGGGLGSLFKLGTYAPSTVLANLGSSFSALKASPFVKAISGGDKLKTGLSIAALGGLTGFLAGQGMDEQEIESIKRDPDALKIYLRQYYTNLNPSASQSDIENFVTQQVGEYAYATGGRVKYAGGGNEDLEYLGWKKMYLENEDAASIHPKHGEFMKRFAEETMGQDRSPEITVNKAYGGRIMKAYGDTASMAAGIEGLPLRKNEAGIKELDLRETGGFIPPVGIKEKADDIPAMLSNNEFVFTADAVRGMGKGDVERGAEKLYSIMKTLENGGRV